MKKINNIKFKHYLEYLYVEARIASILKFIDLKPWTKEQKDTIKQLIEKNKTRAEQLSIDWQRKDLNYDDVYTELTKKSKQQLKKDIRKGLAGLQEGKDYIVLLKNDQFIAYVPLTHKASCAIGRETKWCTAMENNRAYWDEYKNEDTKFIYILPDYIAIAVFQGISKIEVFDKYDKQLYNVDDILKRYGITQQLLRYVDEEIQYPDRAIEVYIKQKNIEKLKKVLQNSDIEITSSMLYNAIVQNAPDILELLLKYKKSLKIPISLVISGFFSIDTNNQNDIIKLLQLLIKYNALDVTDTHIINAIETCIVYNAAHILAALFENYKKIILNNLYRSLDSYFSQILYNDAVDVLEYLHNNNVLTDQTLVQLITNDEMSLLYAINRNNINIIQYLFNIKTIQNAIKNNKQLQQAIINEILMYAPKTMQEFIFDPKNNYDKFIDFATLQSSNKISVIEEILYQKNSLSVFKLLWQNDTIRKHYDVHEIFLKAITAHNYDVCKFLLNTENIDITYNNNKFLQEAVYLDDKNIVKLLFEHGDIDPRTQNYKAFKNAIISRNLEILDILLKYTQKIKPQYKISNNVLRQLMQFADKYGATKCKKILEQYL